MRHCAAMQSRSSPCTKGSSCSPCPQLTPLRSGVGLELHSRALCHHRWHSPNAHLQSTPSGLPCEHHKGG